MTVAIEWFFILSLVAPPAANPPETRSVAAPTEDGRTLFLTYCSSCHGASGRGNGPAAEDFRTRPADLTQLAVQTGGTFVGARIHRVIDGRDHDVRAHGSMEMPVWGDAFKRREGLNDEAVKARIEAIVKYLETIQARAS